MKLRLGCCLVLWGTVAGTARGQMDFERFYPPVVAGGGESVVNAEGKFSQWPVQFTCDRKEIEVAAEKESGQVRVTVPADSPPGVVWIRAHDASAASGLIPLVIGRVGTVAESEPNDRTEQATELQPPRLATGRLSKSGDVDTFAISVSAGQTLVVSAIAHRVLGSPMDMVMQVVDRRGNVLAQSDDVHGIDPMIVYRVQRDGRLWIRVFAFPETPNSTIGFSGSDSFVYLLRVTTETAFDHALPLVGSPEDAAMFRAFGPQGPLDQPVQVRESTELSPPQLFVAGALGWQHQVDGPKNPRFLFDDTPISSAEVARPPIVFSGHIDAPQQIDRVRFRVQKGKTYRATVHSQRLGYAVDSVLRLVDPKSGESLERNDDRSRSQFDAALDYTAKADGQVELQVSDLLGSHGPQHAYSVAITGRQPDVELSLSADRYVCPAGDSLEIEVEVDRGGGFEQSLQVSAKQLPAGVHCEPVTSKPKGDSSKKVTLEFTADPGTTFQGPIRIIGRPVDESGKPVGTPVSARFSLSELIKSHAVWLTVAPKQ